MDLEERFLFQCDSLPSLCYARFKNMKQKKLLCDVTIKFGNHSISAHRLILCAAIPYFSDMFANSESESDLREINMKEIDPSALKSLIDFAYSCEIEITGDNVYSLLIASCSLNVEEVKEACCDFIGKRLNSEKVLFIRKMAEETNCLNLVRITDTFISENFDEIAQTEEFLRMSFAFMLELLARDDLRTSSEENVFEAVMKWIQASPHERKDNLPELLGKVRLTLLSPEYLMDHVHTEEYIQSSIPCRNLLDKVKFYQLLPHTRSKITDLETKVRTYPRRKQNKSRNSIDGIYTVRKTLEVQYFDSENGKWKVVASTPLQPFSALIGFPGHLIFIDADFVRWFSLQDCEWKKKKDFVGRVGVGVAILDNNLYICGGRDKVALNEVERIDLLKNTSQKDTSMLVPRNLLGVVALGGCLYALGGQKGESAYDSVERFDPKTSQWKFLSPMNSKRYGMSCTTMNSKIYVCGGRSVFRSAVLSSAEVFDPFANQWNCISSMQSRRYSCSLVTYCGRLYALGGYDTGLVPLRNVEVYDPEKNKWKIDSSMDSSHEHSKSCIVSSSE